MECNFAKAFATSDFGQKRVQVHFSDFASCRYYNYGDSNPCEDYTERNDEQTETIDNSHSTRIMDPKGGSNIDALLGISDIKLETKRDDGPSPITLATESLILQYFKKGTKILLQMAESPEFNERSIHVRISEISEVQMRLSVLIHRINTTGRASLLPSTSVLRTQHLSALRSLAEQLSACLPAMADCTHTHPHKSLCRSLSRGHECPRENGGLHMHSSPAESPDISSTGGCLAGPRLLFPGTAVALPAEE